MNIKFYPKPDGGGFDPEDIRKGHLWVHADVACPHCDKVQPVTATGYVGGPCVRCGQSTGGK